MAVELELAIDFGAGGNSQTYQGSGWAPPEHAFTWAVGTDSLLRIQPGHHNGGFILTLDVVPFVRPPELPEQRLIVCVNGAVVGSSAFSRPTLLGYHIPAELAGDADALTISLQHPDASRPRDFEASADARPLAFSIAEARLYRVTQENDCGGWAPPRGVMLSGAEKPGFGAPHPKGLTDWIASRVGLDLPGLALKFESIGENCEFGLVQRRCDAEPLGLLRFSSTFLRPLIRGLDDGFAGLGEPDDVEPRLEGDALREYMIHEKRYGLVYHSFVYEGERSVCSMRQQEAARLKFLRRKFIEELEAAEKILVYKRNAPVADEEILSLFLALRRHGDNTLLWVVPAERDRPPGTVEMMIPGLLKGYIDRFAPEDNAHDFSFDGWVRVCANALVLAGLTRSGA
jgi:hypothetical protein